MRWTRRCHRSPPFAARYLRALRPQTTLLAPSPCRCAGPRRPSVPPVASEARWPRQRAFPAGPARGIAERPGGGGCPRRGGSRPCARGRRPRASTTAPPAPTRYNTSAVRASSYPAGTEAPPQAREGGGGGRLRALGEIGPAPRGTSWTGVEPLRRGRAGASAGAPSAAGSVRRGCGRGGGGGGRRGRGGGGDGGGGEAPGAVGTGVAGPAGPALPGPSTRMYCGARPSPGSKY